MIYLLGLFMRWIGQALIPTVLLFTAGALILLVVWRFVLRPRKLAVWKGWLAIGLITVSFGCWRTWEVWQKFSHPELHMFRDFVADPIPKEVQGLAPAIAAPMMFHDGAYISFRAPPELVARIVNHSLPGATTWAAVTEMKRRSSQAAPDRVVIAASDGRSYLKVDLDWVAKENSPESQWARTELETFLKSHQGSAYVLLLSGDWGRFASVLKHEPGTSNVVILQHLERRR
jgi:hypothetical protein